MPYIPHTEAEIKSMLSSIGVDKIEDLWKAIPEDIRYQGELDLPQALTEPELVKKVRSMAGRNLEAGSVRCLLGGGTYHHYIPPLVDQMLSRSEFYTAYTPYQPEISQGTLQAIFEYQTMVCELTGMEVANASMYDGAEASAEAVLMAERISAKNESGAILVGTTVNPLYRRTIATYMKRSGREIIEIGYGPDGRTLVDKILEQEGPLAVVVQHPNYFGSIEDMEAISAACEKTGAVLVVVVTEAMSLGLLKPPGHFGAAIVACEGQSMGIPMGFGGPHLGMFACRKKDARKSPGRLAGQSTDADGRRGFVLTLATREQHIRRAKATSNICTNQGMLALAAAIYMSIMGPDGLRELASICRARSQYLKEKLEAEKIGRIVFSAPTFNEFALDLGRDPGPILKAMAQKGFLAGIPLGESYPDLENSILVAVTETLGEDDLDNYAAQLSRALSEA